MFKVNNRHQNDANDVVLVSLLLTLTYFTPCSSVSIVNFDHVIDGWDSATLEKKLRWEMLGKIPHYLMFHIGTKS